MPLNFEPFNNNNNGCPDNMICISNEEARRIGKDQLINILPRKRLFDIANNNNISDFEQTVRQKLGMLYR